MTSIILIALESSGDLIGARLASEFQKRGVSKLSGLAGKEMRKQGVDSWWPMEDFQAMGPIEGIKKLPKLLKVLRRIEQEIEKNSSTILVFLDSPSFSLRAAKRIKNKMKEAHIVQVVAPSIWAWGRDARKKQIEESIDLLFPLFQFEETLFSSPTIWCGHPLFDETFRQTKLLKSTRPLLALFPGSRPSEIEKNLPLMLRTASQLKKTEKDLIVEVCLSESLPFKSQKRVERTCRHFMNEEWKLVTSSKRYELMGRAWAALAKCGTVTLELFLKQVPTITCYPLRPFERWWATNILRVNTDFFALPNILAGKEVIREYIKETPSFITLAESLQPLLHDHPQGVDEEALLLIKKQVYSSRPAENEIVGHILERFA